jgi:hypothetical protein
MGEPIVFVEFKLALIAGILVVPLVIFWVLEKTDELLEYVLASELLIDWLLVYLIAELLLADIFE